MSQSHSQPHAQSGRTLGQGSFVSVPNDTFNPGIVLRNRRQAANGFAARQLRQEILERIQSENSANIRLPVTFTLEQYENELVSINHGGHPDFFLWVDLNRWAACQALVLKLVQRKTSLSGAGHVYALPYTNLLFTQKSTR